MSWFPMVHRRRVSALLAASCCALAGAGLAAVAEPASADALERTLVGSWRGALEYRDYQSNKKFELPVRTLVTLAADGATLTRVSAFDDGPQSGIVTITTISLYDPTAARVTSASFRKGRAVEVWTDEARVGAYADATHWTLVHEQRGIDGGQSAVIRVTHTRDGDVWSALKEVKPLGATDSAFVFRNQTRLTRQAAP